LSFCENLTDRSLGYIKQMSTLSHLHLRKGREFTETALQNLFEQSENRDEFPKNLQSLSLAECCAVNDRCVEVLARCCKNLISLSLDWCWSVTEQGLTLVIENLSKLICLDLIGMDCVTGSAFADAPAKNLPAIRFIGAVQCNMIDDKMISDLVLRKPDLVVLNYYGDCICALNNVPVEGEEKVRVRVSSVRHEQTIRQMVTELVDSLPGGCCMAPI